MLNNLRIFEKFSVEISKLKKSKYSLLLQKFLIVLKTLDIRFTFIKIYVQKLIDNLISQVINKEDEKEENNI